MIVTKLPVRHAVSSRFLLWRPNLARSGREGNRLPAPGAGQSHFRSASFQPTREFADLSKTLPKLGLPAQANDFNARFHALLIRSRDDDQS
jgi:hypothetical protein